MLLLTDELCFSVGERSVETPNPILDPDKLDPLNVNTRRSCSQQGFLEESCISPPLPTVHFILGYEIPEVKEALSAPLSKSGKIRVQPEELNANGMQPLEWPGQAPEPCSLYL